jgi:hypothetical protein
MLAGTHVGRPHPGEPELWDRVFYDYWWYADRYGWPPSVVDEQPVIILERIREIADVVEDHRREQAERDG